MFYCYKVEAVKTGTLNNEEKYTLNTKYGDIEIVDELNTDNYTKFDKIDDYDIYINLNGDKIIAYNKKETITESLDRDKSDDKDIEILNEDKVDSDIENIKNTYNVEKVAFAISDNAIIIKGNKEELEKIAKEYENKYKISMISDNLLFMEITNDIQLEEGIELDDDTILNNLDDNTLKNLASKSNVQLSGKESKDELKGIIKAELSKK